MGGILSIIAICCAFFAVYNKKVKSTISTDSDDEWTPARKVTDREMASFTPEPKESESDKSHNISVEESGVSQTDETPAYEAPAVQKTVPYPNTPVKNVQRMFGLIGKPLGHSSSMVSFKKKFRAEGISADYFNIELDSAEELRSLVDGHPQLCGLNVTIPYKTDVIQYLDALDDTAGEIGAVNVISIDRSSGRAELKGYNTDWIGFSRSLRPMLPDTPVKALVLGSGGASKAVCYALKKMGIDYDIVSRSSGFDILGYYELSPSVMESHQLIINCTPVGMSPDNSSCPDIPYAYLTSNHILFDLIYNPETTLFMQKGIEHGAAVKNGKEMLQIQAEEAWKIWNGQTDTEQEQVQ